MSKRKIEKPSLAEIFYAVSAVTHAGITGYAVKNDQLIGIGGESALFHSNIKAQLMNGECPEEGAAQFGLEFLKERLPLLKKFSDTALMASPKGAQNSKKITQKELAKISELVDHIEEMLVREEVDAPRAESVVSKSDGAIKFVGRRHKPTYLSVRRKERQSKAEATQAAPA